MAYVTEADKLCRMLAATNIPATSAGEQVSLLAQRARENEAHVEYLRARKRLLRRAGLRSALGRSRASTSGADFSAN
jgi:hypothetical protein